MKLDKQFKHLKPLLRTRKDGYLEFSKNGKTHLLHRFILGAKKGEIVDHKNGNRADNRLSNLRLVTPSQNSYNKRVVNRTGFKGVEFHNGTYRATIQKEGKRTRLHGFGTAEEAFRAYKKLARKKFGEYARWK